MSKEKEVSTALEQAKRQKNVCERIEQILKREERLKLEYDVKLRGYNIALAKGLETIGKPPTKQPLELDHNDVFALKLAQEQLLTYKEITDALLTDENAKRTKSVIEAAQRALKVENNPEWESLKDITIKAVSLPPEIHTSNGRLVAFTCRACGGHTILTHGSAIYHCPKCGQKLYNYNTEGIWGNANIVEDAPLIEALQAAKEQERQKDEWEIGKEYDLLIEIPAGGKGTDADPTVMVRRKYRCTLLGIYKRNMLFEYEEHGVRIKKYISNTEICTA